ncbi:hypothetical protein [Arthrobacter ulcerisalmonis]|uniref:hypothetical protein n=1 Tax=Arthrobacter ulcerisalmonis TaxID=2483813 RepID=UPI001EF0EF9C|nr:hypothetical protein [Arthrobacter ulcerisalmonis]
MRKLIFAIGAMALPLGLASCGGTPEAVPAVTVTQTVTATRTVAAPAPTVTVTQVAAPVATVAAAPPAASSAVLPADVVGTNAKALSDDLEALGFKHIVWNADTGKTVLLLSNWTVTSLEGAGADTALSKTIVVHVTKPGS